MSEKTYIETTNAKAEQVAFIGRAMERSGEECSLSEYLMTAALDKAKQVMETEATGKEVAL